MAPSLPQAFSHPLPDVPGDFPVYRASELSRASGTTTKETVLPKVLTEVEGNCWTGDGYLAVHRAVALDRRLPELQSPVFTSGYIVRNEGEVFIVGGTYLIYPIRKIIDRLFPGKTYITSRAQEIDGSVRMVLFFTKEDDDTEIACLEYNARGELRREDFKLATNAEDNANKELRNEGIKESKDYEVPDEEQPLLNRNGKWCLTRAT
jgi:hypothetical protein